MVDNVTNNDGDSWSDAEIERSILCRSCGVSSLPPEIPGEVSVCENPDCEAFGESV